MYCTVIIVIVFGVDMHCIYIMIIMIILAWTCLWLSWSFITLTHDRNKRFSHLWSGNANDWGLILPDFTWAGFSEGGPNQSQLCADHVINLTVQTAWHKVIASWWFWQVGKRRDGLLIVTIIMTRIIMITTERDDDHVLCWAFLSLCAAGKIREGAPAPQNIRILHRFIDDLHHSHSWSSIGRHLVKFEHLPKTAFG